MVRGASGRLRRQLIVILGVMIGVGWLGALAATRAGMVVVGALVTVLAMLVGALMIRQLGRNEASLVVANQQAEALLAAGVLCSRGLPPAQLLAELVAVVAKVAPCDRATLTLVDEAALERVACFPADWLPVGAQTRRPSASETGFAAGIVGDVYLVNDLPGSDHAMAAQARALSLHAMAVLPLVSEGHGFGALALASAARDRPFDDGHLRFFQALRTHISGALWAVELNRRLRERASEVERASRAKSEFLAMMSHELRTPLNAVIGFSEVLTDPRIGALNERQQRYLHNIQASGRHLLGIINDLLDFSRIEAGRMDVARQILVAEPIISEVTTSLHSLAAAKRLTVTIDIADSTPAMIGDALRVKQGLYNLVSNAIKFTPEDGTIAVTVATGGTGHAVRISVRDTGPGIPDGDRDRLFQPFSQLDHQRKGGTGLGLALTRRLVELMGGRVGLAPSDGGGACFWLELPAAPRRDGVAMPADAPVALIVEDDPLAIELLELSLRALGFRPISAQAGDDAVAQARRHRPALITLDVYLPSLGGWDVLRLLRATPETATIPVLMVTVSSDRETSLRLGAVEHLMKPLSQDALRAAIDRLPRAQA